MCESGPASVSLDRYYFNRNHRHTGYLQTIRHRCYVKWCNVGRNLVAGFSKTRNDKIRACLEGIQQPLFGDWMETVWAATMIP